MEFCTPQVHLDIQQQMVWQRDMFRRSRQTRLDFLKPCTKETVRKKPYQPKEHHDRTAADRFFIADDAVYLRSTVTGSHKWIPGLIVRQTGPVSYEVRERNSDTVHRRHGDQLRARAIAEPDIDVTESQAELGDGEDGSSSQEVVDANMQTPELLEPEPVVLRRSNRMTKPPKRYMP
ncbi:hypothetical protein VZT92_012532 [Zoarces viviparus]|uniref:Uncharacterized protein n=1 Tax=Zoarces viviparus TaxID=48416 RepID=A0AAW1F0I0_ZOAVI